MFGDKDPISRINPNKVAEYLRNHNWHCTHADPNDRSTFWEKDGRSVQLIPDPSLYNDYSRRMRTLIKTVAEVDRPAEVDIYGIMPTIENINGVYDWYHLTRIIFLLIFGLIVALLLLVLYGIHPTACAFGFVIVFAVFLETFVLCSDE